MAVTPEAHSDPIAAGRYRAPFGISYFEQSTLVRLDHFASGRVLNMLPKVIDLLRRNL